ncbi:MAG: L-2-amino-thiazoline-4-carboxylic acid hydrolase [Solobacterium sp.]|nr:L-2-amino-thiazoline-4-carboxylic acid hydrolase [Solobacterium sp.]
MKEKDLPFDRSKHAVYSKNAKRCVQRLLRCCYDRKEAEEMWEKVQLQYCEYLKDEPALKDLKITASIYDPILVFAWHAAVPEKPAREFVQQEICRSFFGSFELLGKVFDLNRKPDMRLAAMIFRKANDIRIKEIRRFPASFRMGYYAFDRQNNAVRYSFTQCPNAEFAKRHNMEDVLPLMCNCDHLAMQKIHACLIREGTCVTADRCDYCIVGDRDPIAAGYELKEAENGLLLSVRKEPV